MFNITNVNHLSGDDIQKFLLNHSRHQFDGKTTYSTVMDLSKLDDIQMAEINHNIVDFNRTNKPYHVINTSIGFNRNVFVLVAMKDEPEGITVKALDFHKNWELAELEVLAKYCKTIVMFDNFCVYINEVVKKFRTDNMNRKLMPASVS